MNQLVDLATLTGAQPLATPGGRAAVPVTVAFGDGIGPEIMAASLGVLFAAGADIAVEPIEIGERAYRAGNTAGIGADAWDSLRRTRVFYKAPITTPRGGGHKSVNVTVRKGLGLFANVRPVSAYAPFVATKHPGMDVVVVRENEEDVYAGIEHRQTDEVYQCLKLVSRSGCERIVRYAFEYARANARRKVTCFTKDNIMKLTDGLLHRVFDAVGAEYPDIAKEHMIVDIGAAKLAADPGRFDVIVTSNLYGDIVSDVAAEIAGSVGLAPSANVGRHGAMFEAVHGSAPDIAGQGVANPSGLLLAGAMMLAHIGQPRAAERVRNAWLRAVEDGVHTPDVFVPGVSREKVGTSAFAEAVIAHLGQEPAALPPARYGGGGQAFEIPEPGPAAPAEKTLAGVDVFVHWKSDDPGVLAERMRKAQNGAFDLAMITNRGVKVWPQGLPETALTDHWRCRYLAKPGKRPNTAMIAALQLRLAEAGVDFIKTEHLCAFGGVPGYSLGHGQ